MLKYYDLIQTLGHEDCVKFINWEGYLKENDVPEESIGILIDSYSLLDYISLDKILKLKNVSEDFLKKYYGKYDINVACRHQVLSEFFIEKHIKKMNPSILTAHQKLSEEFMEKYSEYIDWELVTLLQDYSEEFFKRNEKKMNKFLVNIRRKMMMGGDELIDIMNYK